MTSLSSSARLGGAPVAHSSPPCPVDALAVVARRLALADDLSVLLAELPKVAPLVVAGAEHVSVTLIDKGRITATSAGDDVARRWASCQQQTGEGPTIDALRGETGIVVVPDLAGDQRWSRWRALLAQEWPGAPGGALLALRLDAGRGQQATLTLHSRRPRSFDRGATSAATALSIHASIAMATVAKHDNLRVALESRDTIGQAKGILMERLRVTADEAFDLLVGASQRTNRKLRDIAEQLTTTGELVAERVPHT
ncbi:ANTAR domain-containing protein [Nakamurella flava]|uniref:ANTAR domain-containing protein n=1 Tax=Nakamurella flava TaxID=2576308 RepID=A0A4U6QBP8_9ACTN|nr:ANTAR domain-containing protein [Nakamurella flava]TKV57342.1 ANTAR domain-containing protein [Nakamurella flava]